MKRTFLFATIASILSINAYAVSSTVTSKDYVDNALETKQDTIETGLVDLNGYDLPAIVSYDETNGITGNRIGILDQETIADDEGLLYIYHDGGYDSGEMDNYVPTVRAVANALNDIWGNMPAVTPLTWNNNDTAAVNNYSTTFNGTTNNWPTAQSTQYVRGAVLANGLALKQNKLSAGTTPNGLYIDGSVLTYTNTAGTVGERYIIDTHQLYDMLTGHTQWDSNYDDMLITVDDLKIGLDTKQDKLGGTAVQAGKVVTATATAGNVTYTAIDGTVTNASSNLVTSGAVYTAVNARQAKKTCAGWMDGTTVPDATHTDANCVLWNLPD